MSDTRVRELLDIVSKPPAPTSAGAREVMRANHRRDSMPELRLRSELHAAGLRFRVDHPIRVPGFRPIRPDLVFTRRRIAVFVDGCFWHGCPDHGTTPGANARYWNAKIELNQSRDERQSEALRLAGWEVIRLWEHEPPLAAAHRILDAYAARDSGA